MSLKLKIIFILFLISLSLAFYLVSISERVFVANENENVIIEIDSFKEDEQSDITKIDEQLVDTVQTDESESLNLEQEKERGNDESLEINNELEMLDILFNVPFTPQAPYAEWNDPVHQDGCEEAASLMAVSWARGEKLNQAKAKNEIVAASDYQKENFGEYRDASAEDTVKRIIQGYFKYENAKVKLDININDIIFELANGNIIILPMDGQKLNNLYYTPPGPVRHMIVVIGYDEEKKEFITNDPGTKRGESYRYSEDVLYNAIRDYSTGYHELIKKQEKTMIVVKPE